MTNVSQTQEMQTDQMEVAAEERSHRVTTTAWLAGASAFLGFMTLESKATIGAGIAFVGIAGMVAVVCYFILRAR
jgi:hypothetical protein